MENLRSIKLRKNLKHNNTKRLLESILDGKSVVNGLKNKKKEKLIFMKREIKIYKLNWKS